MELFRSTYSAYRSRCPDLEDDKVFDAAEKFVLMAHQEAVMYVGVEREMESLLERERQDAANEDVTGDPASKVDGKHRASKPRPEDKRRAKRRRERLKQIKDAQ